MQPSSLRAGVGFRACSKSHHMQVEIGQARTQSCMGPTLAPAGRGMGLVTIQLQV